ncbi:MAG: hypothetical protein HYW24_04580 [Candidatus Aenigmarchaeota archaeon]|nr:hypothetical protein [Candidatus Aenigmarchaeota archaeon]
MDKSFIMALIPVVFLAGCTTGSINYPRAVGLASTGVEHTVEITSSGFSPSNLDIQLGDSVVFLNKDTERHWPASDDFPTNDAYPEKGGCLGSKFDACKSLKQNDAFAFTFYYSGEWCYHDHLSPKIRGCVNVE